MGRLKPLDWGLVFDFDGLILDTESVEYSAAVGLQPIWAEPVHGHLGACIGTQHEFDPILHLKEIAELELPAQGLHRLYRARFCCLIRNEKPRPGVVDYLESAQEMGLKLAIASSSPMSWVEGFQRILASSGISTLSAQPMTWKW